MDRVTVADLETISWQIGRRPRGVRAVAKRCSFGFPQAIQVMPVIDEAPFPTLFWLTCPHLLREVSRLEADGWVGQLEARMAGDAKLAGEMADAHERYVALRESLLSPETREKLIAQGRYGALKERGIGGLSDRSRLKCLHLHVAHELGESNPIGAIVLHQLANPECSEKNGICSAR